MSISYWLCFVFKIFIGAFVSLLLAALVQIVYKKWKGRRILEQLQNKHVLITGGSQGIGKAMAALCFKNGASVTLFARDPVKLDRAKKEILGHRANKQQQVNCFSVDITKLEEVNKSVEFVLKTLEPVDILINCAGNSIPEHVELCEIETFEKMMSINYFGSVYVTKSLLDSMKKRGQGRIVFVSSVAGLFGLFGFSAYSPAKFAVIGFAQCLDMELREYGVNVSLVLPPDTDTPGFEQEEKNKPLETKLMCETGGLSKPEQVAEKALKDILLNNFVSTFGLESYLVQMAGSGCFPVRSYLQLFLESITIGFCRLAFGFFLISCQRVVHQCKQKRQLESKDN